MVLNNIITAGDLASFLLYSMLVAGNISSLSSTYADVMKAVGASGRVFRIIDRIPDMPSIMDNRRKERQQVTAAEGEIVGSAIVEGTSTGGVAVNPLSIDFNNITFSYPLRRETNVLGPAFQLSIQAGEKIAIVGGSGSGKSTVAALLTRLYDVDDTANGSGVYVGGLPIVDMNPQELRETVGIVAQEPILFATSIMENIRYGRLDATDDEVEAAARAARVLEFSKPPPPPHSPTPAQYCFPRYCI
jgi:ABC-type multidrug transport system fused ATPase/permease subunit